MIVTEFEIDHFRGRNSLRLLDLGNGLNVALVGNNMDKTAMLSVVPYVLYGTVAEDARKWVDSIHTDAGLVVQTDNGVFRLDRLADDPEDVLIRSPDGMAAEPGYLDTLVDGVGPRTFFSTFALNTRNLRRRLDRRRRHVADDVQQMAEFLRDASPQPDVRIPSVSLKPLREMDSCVSQLKQAIGAQAELERDQLKLLANLPNREQLGAELKRNEHELADAQAKEQRAVRELEETRLAIIIQRLRERLTAIEDDLAKLREAPTKPNRAQSPDAGIATIDEKLRRCRERLEQLREQQRESRETLGDDDRVTRMRRMIPRVEAVLLQDKFIATEEQSIEQLADTIRDLEARIESDRVTAESRAAELATDSERAAQSLGDIDRLGAQVKEAKRRYRISQRRIAKSSVKSSGKDGSSTKVTKKPTNRARSQSKAVDDAESTVARLRERIDLERTLSSLNAERDEADTQLRRLYGQHLPPLPMLMMLGLPFALGGAMILNGYYRYDPANLQLMGLGALILVVTSLIKLSTDNVNGDQLFQIRNQLIEFDREIDDADAFREEFDSAWPDTIRPWQDQLEYAERQLEILLGEVGKSASRRRDRNRNREVAKGQTNPRRRERVNSRIGRRRLTESRQRYRDSMARWSDLLTDVGLPTTLSPSQARLAVEQKVLEAQSASPLPSSALEFQLRQLRNDLERRRDGLAEIMGQSRQLVQELGYSLNGATTGEQMDILRETVQEHREFEKERAVLDAHFGNLQTREDRLQRYGRRLNRQRREIVEELDKHLNAETMRQQMRAERARLLERERDHLVQQVENAVLHESDGATVTALSELSGDQLETRLNDLRSHQQDSQLAVVGLVDLRARVHERLKQLDHIEKLAARETPWDNVLATTQDLSQQWKSASRDQRAQTKELASHLRQAETYQCLQLAAENYSSLAGHPVDLSFDHKGALRVLTKSGKWSTLRRMNQYRLGQLYVCLWLARIQEFADRGVKMPVVLDDVLSLASRRRVRLARLLRDFAARGHQLLLITSNKKHADVFGDLEVPIADLADRETVTARDGTVRDGAALDDETLDDETLDDETLDDETPDDVARDDDNIPSMTPEH